MLIYISIVFVFAVSYSTLLRRYGRLWRSIPEQFNQKNRPESESSKITILVPFRNEADSLPGLISSLNELDISGYDVEVIFINDHSSDESCEKLNACKLPYKLIELGQKYGKKEAIQLGWSKSKGEFVFQTDADCELPAQWLKSMMSNFIDSSVILVSGPVVFIPHTSFWEKVMAIDFSSLISIGAAHIQWGRPLMCNGANLAYRKSLVSRVNLHTTLASGDDVFLLQSVHKLYPSGISFCKLQSALVRTRAPENLRLFWNQRIRWAGKNSAYDSQSNAALMVGVWLFNLLILCSLCSFTDLGLLGGSFLLSVKAISEIAFHSKHAAFFNIKSGYKYIILGQLFHIIYMVILPPLSQVISYQWKERKFN